MLCCFFPPDLSQFLHVGFATSFGDLLLNKKQKKPFVSLNNEVSEASNSVELLAAAVRAETSNDT